MVTWRTNEVALILRMCPMMRQRGGPLRVCPSSPGTTTTWTQQVTPTHFVNFEFKGDVMLLKSVSQAV